MKITATSADQLSAIDHNYTQLIVAPIMAVIALVMIAVGVVGHKSPIAIFGVIFLLVGVVLLLTRKTRTLTISKSAGNLTLVTKGITGSKNYTCNLADIVKIQLVSEYHTQYSSNTDQRAGSGVSFGAASNANVQQTTHLNVLERDGTIMNISESSRSASGVGGVISHVPDQGVGEQIAQFLGVPFEAVGPTPPTLGSAVAGLEQMLHHNDAAPSVAPVAPPPVPVQPTQPASSSAQPEPAQPVPPAGPANPDAAGFAMPHNLSEPAPSTPETPEPPQTPPV